MRISALASAVALALAAGACDRSGDSSTDVTTNAVANDDAMANAALGADQSGTISAALPSDATGFANAVAAGDLYEIESAKLALDKSASADVKGIAQMLQHDHEKSTADLKAIAAAGKLTLAPAVDSEQQGLIDRLKGLNGADFDREFLSQQHMAHQKALTLLQNYAQVGDNDALKGFATKVQTIVKDHLDHLNAITK